MSARPAPARPVARWFFALGVSRGIAATGASAPPLDVFTLDNGMTFALVSRPGAPLVAAGWVVGAGSADESPGQTGASHLLEHLLFRGTRTVGARAPAQEPLVLAEQDAVEARLRAADLAPAERARHQQRARRLAAQAQALGDPGAYAALLARAGASGINASTRQDLTLFFMHLPPSRLELWFWLESDRLREPVLRGFYDELPVVRQERLQRIDAVPGGNERELFVARFFGESHPYSWPAGGRVEDLPGLLRPQVSAFMAQHYRPERLAAVLVGDLDPARVRDLAERYFGRLPARGGSAPPAAMPAAGGVRLRAGCDCAPQVLVRYPTVPITHPDRVVLDVLAAVLAGRSGRLHRRLVQEGELAIAVDAYHSARRRAGFFEVRVEGREGVAPERLEAAWLTLREELGSWISDDELT